MAIATNDSNSPIARSTAIFRRSFFRTAWFAASLPNGLTAALWSDPNSLIESGEVLRASGARKTVRLAWNSRPYVLKHYVEPNWWHTVKQTVQPARAWKTWSFAHRLANAGVATPRPVACIENRCGILRRDSYLMYPYINGCTLRSYFAADAAASPTLREEWRREIHALWQRLIELRVSLGDTNLGNFIVGPTKQLWLIDLDKSHFHDSAKAAAPYQERAFRQLLRSAGKCGAREIVQNAADKDLPLKNFSTAT